jgi:hypothetical protein
MPHLRRGRPEGHLHHIETEATGDNAVFRGMEAHEKIP